MDPATQKATGAATEAVPGRACPLDYHHARGALRSAAELRGDRFWVAGGVYGNVEALDALSRRAEADGNARLVLNGDFHWFDVDPRDFEAIQARADAHVPLAGNVETELVQPHSEAGCGCAYPAFVDDATVERSNAIMRRLLETARACPQACGRLDGLPRLLRLSVAGTAVGVVHGDPESLAGWGLAVENLAANGGTTDAAKVGRWAREGGVSAFACSHTCLPWTARFGDVAVINNGSAGMPNFRDRAFALATRLAPRDDPAPDALYARELGGLRLEAIPIEYDAAAWWRRFERNWPPGSPAHESYATRIRTGPRFRRDQADLPDQG